MNDVIITVRGENSTPITAEIGTPTVSVRLDGADRADVVARATQLAAVITDELRAYDSAGALVSWSSDRVSVWSDRPWNQQGEQLPLVYHATLTSRAEFTDFTALSEWLTQLAEREGVAVDDVQWALTPETAQRTESDVAQAAIAVAVARATAYAAALGRTDVTPLEIADQGLLSSPTPESGGGPMMMRASSAKMADSAGGLSLEPRRLTVSATVEARFVAR